MSARRNHYTTCFFSKPYYSTGSRCSTSCYRGGPRNSARWAQALGSSAGMGARRGGAARAFLVKAVFDVVTTLALVEQTLEGHGRGKSRRTSRRFQCAISRSVSRRRQSQSASAADRARGGRAQGGAPSGLAAGDYARRPAAGPAQGLRHRGETQLQRLHRELGRLRSAHRRDRRGDPDELPVEVGVTA